MDDKGSFVRWQANAMAQLGNALSLILGLALASLGFAFGTVATLQVAGCWTKTLLTSSLFLLMFAIAIGLACALNRLCDFRVTMRIARLRELDPSDSELQYLRPKAKKLGKRTWVLFYIHVVTFGLGFIALSIALIIIQRAKLF